MAESIIYGLVQTMIENLGSQIFQEIGKICSLKKELEKLKKTVSRIQAIYSRMQRSNKFIAIKSDWLDRLKDADNEVDEFLKEFNTSRQRRRGIKS